VEAELENTSDRELEAVLSTWKDAVKLEAGSRK
jgi:hypothetical protein